MQLLGALFQRVLEQRGERLNVLGATSGDTGSAAEYAMRGRDRIKVFMLSPNGRMRAFQREQSIRSPSKFSNFALERIRRLPDIVNSVAATRFKQRSASAVSTRSIGAGLVSAGCLYFKGYLAATQSSDQKVSFAVPSGNFGNILSGWVAKQMGLPIDRLVLATNENDVLDEFFRTGRYRVRSSTETHATSSPSMDISKASNFEALFSN